MKNRLLKSVALSLLSPLLMGALLGLYYGFISNMPALPIFASLLVSALLNAHVAGLAMGVFVLPGYLFMYKHNKVRFSAVLTLGLLGGAFFSYIFAAQSGGAFIVNAVMSALAAGLFLYGLRRF